MPLTPIDIQQKTFGPELRGYNMDEVDDFLDDVVVALKDYDQRLRDAEDRIRALEAELSTRGEDESAISRALVTAQKQADSLIAEARVDAEKIRSDAEGEADELRSDREAEKMSLTQDIARMRATVADMKRRIVELASAVSSDLDDMDHAAADAANGIGSDLSELPDEESEMTTPSPGYMGAAVGEGLDPFAETDGADSDSPEAAPAVESYGRSGQHLSAVQDDYDADGFDTDVDDDQDDDVDFEVDAEPVVDLEDDFDDDAEFETKNEEFSGSDSGEFDDESMSNDDASDDDDSGVSRFTERRPWERGSV